VSSKVERGVSLNHLQWIRQTLTSEGIVIHKRNEKHLFTQKDLNNIFLVLWTNDDLVFIPERYPIQFTFIFLVYCWTGARISVFSRMAFVTGYTLSLTLALVFYRR
jgi:hypothetical protein